MAFYTRAGLRGAAQARSVLRKSASSLLSDYSTGASQTITFDIFLSHSSLEAEEIGFTVYVDWIQDPELDRSKVSPSTAERLRGRMNQCRSLLYAASPSATDSKWMPWELGYFDGIKGRVAILPVLERDPGTEVFHGQEYLGLYPYVTKDRARKTQQLTLWVLTDSQTYVSFQEWLEGREPSSH